MAMGSSAPSVAVMQPYFFPYLGYYRLFYEADIVVLFDCVQFPRRGWVHRNKFESISGEMKWLSLPIKHCPQQTAINKLEFDREDKRNSFNQSLRNFRFSRQMDDGLKDYLFNFDSSVVSFLEKQIRYVCEKLALPANIMRSSDFNVPLSFKGQDRVLEILKYLSANSYINLSNGLDYYSPTLFFENRINLRILKPYTGNFKSALDRVHVESKEDIIREIQNNIEYYV